MRIGIFVGACGLAVAAATSADVQPTAPATTNIEDRSVDAMHRAIGAPGSVQRERVVADLRDRVRRGEISPFKVLLSDAIPDYKVAPLGGDFGQNPVFGGSLNINATSRGGGFSTFDDTFSSYTLSDDPIFDRFQVSMAGLTNPSGEDWTFSQGWYIPSLFVDGQTDGSGEADPLPRWQGAIMVEDDSIGQLSADFNGDTIVDTADLGQLIGAFGSTTMAPDPFSPFDLNEDRVVDTADLGSLIGQFGMTSGPFCVYVVDAVQTTDPDGAVRDPATIAAGPSVNERIGILNGAYNNDDDADGCPDCLFFQIEPDGAVNNETIFGTWTLEGLSTDMGVGTPDFVADVTDDTCSGYGMEAVLADSRAETDIIENACCFFGATTMYPLFAPVLGDPLIMEFDCYYPTIDTFQWVDTTSSVEGFTVTRTFMGGFAASLDPDFIKFSTNASGFLNHFVFLGNLPGNFQFGQFYGTVPDTLVGNQGKEILTEEWFTLSYRLTPNDVSVWLRDSETVALADPMPGDDGSGTPQDGDDDIEDGFAKIFPIGPFGISPGVDDGQVPDIPQAPLAAVSSDTMRFLWAGAPTQDEIADYEPTDLFYDNIHVEGVLFPVPDLPKFALNYLDDVETYFSGANLALQGGRWFDALSSRAVIDDSLSVSGNQSISQENTQTDGQFRLEFETDLPLASSITATWTASVEIALSNTTTARTIRLGDDSVGLDENTATVARLFTGVNDENGVVVTEPGPVPPMGSSRIYMRVANPNFNELVEPEARDIDLEPPAMAINSRFINVPTDIFWSDQNIFHNFSFEVDSAQNLIVRRDGTVVNPDPVEAPAVGYTAAGWTASSNSIDEMSFESSNNTLAPNTLIYVDDVMLEGFGLEIADGPTLELPYSDDFEAYPTNAPIDGQGDTPFVDGGTLQDGNLRIEQGLQALTLAASQNATWCEYMIKSDAIGGIDPGNEWGLADGDSIFVLKADCDGPVACKDLQCFTNPNRPDEFIPNAGLFDEAEVDPKTAAGVRLSFVGEFIGDPIVSGETANDCAIFEWDTYDPMNVFCKYVVNTIDDADPDTPGQQNVAEALLPSNQVYNDSIGGKIVLGDTIAVDQVFGIDDMTGLAPCPGIIDMETVFRIVDPCDMEILTGTWTYIGDGAGEDAAQPLDCDDVPHFNFVFDGFPRYTGGLGGEILVLDDPTGNGFGNVLKAINNGGFVEDGGSLFVSLRSTYPDAFAITGTDVVFEVDVYVTDLKSRYALQLDGPNGGVTDIQFGGPDLDPVDSPGGTAIPDDTFAFLERNPNFGGPFSMGPEFWFYDTGTTVPLNQWFRLQVTVDETGSYTVGMDQSGVPGGDGTFETAISTGDGDETNGASAQSGQPVTVGANSIDGFDTNTGLDFGGDGAFIRDPIEITEDSTLPGADDPGFGAPPFIDEGDFCYYILDAVDGASFDGTLPPECTPALELDGVLGLRRNAALPNWPNSGNVDICPESPEFIWNNEAVTDQCTGEWSYIDPDDPSINNNYPTQMSEVTSWAQYTTIPPFSSVAAPSTWFFDNISLDGSDTE